MKSHLTLSQKEVHLRIASPPIKFPDYYGVDTPSQNELLASKLDIKGMRKFINAKSLDFLSIDGLYKSMGYDKRNPLYPQFTDHCFTGEYPVEPIDIKINKGLRTTLLSNKK